VLVHGATGAVGTAAVQLAKSRGLKIVATGGTEQGRRRVAAQGADRVLDHHGPDYLDDLMEWTGGRGVDVIVEMLANVNLGRDLKILAPGGRVVIVGSRGEVQINPREAMQRNASVLGMLLGGVPTEAFERIHAALGAGLANGTLAPVVAKEIPLAEAAAAHRRILAPGTAGQLVLIP
jgi:NADPH2:quinone reductase